MNVIEANKVLEQMYQLNKQHLQTVRRYPELISTNKHLPPELGYVQEKFDWIVHQYFRVLRGKLIDLAKVISRKLFLIICILLSSKRPA